MKEDVLLLNQLSQLAAALFAGFFGGLAFDVYQKLCYNKGGRRRRSAAFLKGDAIFALIIISAWLIFWFLATDGSLRVSVFIWLAGGFALYFLVFSKRLTGIFNRSKCRFPHLYIPFSRLNKVRRNGKIVDEGAYLAIKIYKKTDNAFKRFISNLKKLFARRQKKE